MANECTFYCDECNEGFCEHCESPEEIEGSFYCDICAKQKRSEKEQKR